MGGQEREDLCRSKVALTFPRSPRYRWQTERGKELSNEGSKASGGANAINIKPPIAAQ
ncbi:MAG: hypothetical protein HZLCBSQH_000419 [Candidatus Fervidibacterota bacterium]